MPCPSPPPAVVQLLRFRVNIQGTFCPKPPAMIGTTNAGFSERLPATDREKEVISGAPFIPPTEGPTAQTSDQPRSPGRQLQGLVTRLLWRETQRKQVPAPCAGGPDQPQHPLLQGCDRGDKAWWHISTLCGPVVCMAFPQSGGGPVPHTLNSSRGGGEFGRHCRGFYNQPLSSRQFRPKPGSLPRWGAGGGVLGTTVSTDRNTCVICPRSSVKCYLLWPGPFCPPETERMSEPQLSSQFQWSGKVRGGANASKITINNSEMHTDYNSLSAGFPSSPVTTAMWLGGGGSHSKGCASCIEVP